MVVGAVGEASEGPTANGTDLDSVPELTSLPQPDRGLAQVEVQLGLDAASRAETLSRQIEGYCGSMAISAEVSQDEFQKARATPEPARAWCRMALAKPWSGPAPRGVSKRVWCGVSMSGFRTCNQRYLQVTDQGRCEELLEGLLEGDTCFGLLRFTVRGASQTCATLMAMNPTCDRQKPDLGFAESLAGTPDLPILRLRSLDDTIPMFVRLATAELPRLRQQRFAPGGIGRLSKGCQKVTTDNWSNAMGRFERLQMLADEVLSLLQIEYQPR